MPYQEPTRERTSHTPETPLRKPVDRLEDDATGINVDTRSPIDPRMPHMPPA